MSCVSNSSTAPSSSCTAKTAERLLISGNDAIALSALHLGFTLGTGYPGTPSTEILETLASLNEAHCANVRTQWAPNEKVALEVAIGAAFAGARALATMKHVGVNVAADPLFSVAYAEVPGALVLICADDPGMASSQNEQDSRRHAIAAGVPVLEPSDAQQAYDYLALAVEIAERWHVPVMLRMTTRVCHSKSVVRTRHFAERTNGTVYERNFVGRVLLPANARLAHRQLRTKLSEIAQWAETSLVTEWSPGASSIGIICSGVTANYVREVVPDAHLLVLGMCHPAPIGRLRDFVQSVETCIALDEGDPILYELLRTAGLNVQGRPEEYRFGELNVERVRELLCGRHTSAPTPVAGRAPALCLGCPHRAVFGVVARHNLIVSGDIGCYTLAALPPISAMDTVVCMGASIGIGLGLRHTLEDTQSRKVVSVIGDSTFVHSGLTGLVEMVYNPPANGHVVIVLDNGTTAMTGQQEHPATGRSLGRKPTARLSIERVAEAIGVNRVAVVDPCSHEALFEQTLIEMLNSGEPCVLVARRACLLTAKRLHEAKSTPSPCSAELVSAATEGST